MPTRATRRSKALTRIVAVLLVALACADLALDAGCDPLPVPASQALLAAPPGRAAGPSDEQCATVCVPDCYCCSRTLVRAPAIVPATSGLVTAAPEACPAAAPAGVHPVPYHPPLDRA